MKFCILWEILWRRATEEIIQDQLDIKLGQFTEDEHDTIVKTIKNRKVVGLDKILPEVWKTPHKIWTCHILPVARGVG